MKVYKGNVRCCENKSAGWGDRVDNGNAVSLMVTEERLVTFDTVVLFEGPAEVGQDPQRQ